MTLMRRKHLHIFAVVMLAVILVTAGCTGNRSHGTAGGDTLRLKYAKLLTIVRHNGYTAVSLADPWHKGKTLHRYLLIPSGKDGDATLKTLAKDGGTVVRTPVRRSIVFTTVHSSLLTDLKAGNAISGVCDLQYMLIPWIQRAVAEGRITDCGNSMNADIEKIISVRPQALLLSPFEKSGGYGKLDNIHIPIIECADYMEQSPLGRAEWMKFYGMLFGRQAEADSLFDSVERSYTQLKAKASHSTDKPKVITELKTGSVWYVPGGRSYVAQLISDAGGKYAFASDNNSGSLSCSEEMVLLKAGDADVWLYKYDSHPATLKELLSADNAYSQIKAFRTGRVYGADCSAVPFYEEASFHPDRVLSDMMTVFHPEQFRRPTYYYKQIPQ